MCRLIVSIAIILLVRVAASRNEDGGGFASLTDKPGNLSASGVTTKNVSSSIPHTKAQRVGSAPGEKKKPCNKAASPMSAPDYANPSVYSGALYQDQINNIMDDVLRMFNGSDSVSSQSTDTRHSYGGGGGQETNYLYGEIPHYPLYPQGYQQIYQHQPSAPLLPLLPKPLSKPSLVNEHESDHVMPLPPLPVLPKPVASKPAMPLTGLLGKLMKLANLFSGVMTGTDSGSTGLLSTLISILPQLITLKNSLKGVISKALVPIIILILINLEVIALIFWLWEECPQPTTPTHASMPLSNSHLPNMYYRTPEYFMPSPSMYGTPV